MADQRTAPIHHLQRMLNERQLQRDLPPTHALKVCDEAVVDSPDLQHYLNIKHNQAYLKVTQFSEFRPWRKLLSITAEHVFAICDRHNKQCLHWVVMGDRNAHHGLNSENCTTFT